MYNNEVPGLDYGYMTCDSGNMFGGKSDSLIYRVNRLILQETLRKKYCAKEKLSFRALKIGVFVHKIDKRYSDGTFVASHNGLKMPAIPVGSCSELEKIVRAEQFDVIAIDEIQFFQEKDEEGRWKIVNLLLNFIHERKYIMVAGLEKDFRGYPFGPTGDLMAISDEKESHHSICTVCGDPAILSQRFVNGQPAYEDDPIIIVGAKEAYEPRCRKHHLLRRREESSTIKSAL